MYYSHNSTFIHAVLILTVWNQEILTKQIIDNYQIIDN